MTKSRRFTLVFCFLLLGVIAWLGRAGQEKAVSAWTEVVPGVLRSPGQPAAYALVDGDRALLIDAPLGPQEAAKAGLGKIDMVLLTHYHRPSCQAVGAFLQDRIPVRAAKAAEEWLSPARVQKYWQESLPLRNSRTAYLVTPAGFEGIGYDLVPGQTISWRGWDVQIVDTPGHARSHLAFLVRKGKTRIAFVGGALAVPGKMWAPYTTDWDHWTDAGLTPAAKSLRLLAKLQPDILCPAHGPVIAKDAPAALLQTAAAVEDVAFLKSFERFTKERLGNQPNYAFLVKEQAMSNGSKPWSKVSDHLFLTGNTYVLTSRDNVCLMIDPWDKRGADQFAKLHKDQNLGPLEVVMFSHAHYDHYDGIYYLPDRDKFQVWTLDRVATPIADPFLWRAPFLDARPVRIDRRPRAGDTLAWREYRFRFQHLPGQSEFTMGFETTIDGKRCYFTADNFFHQDMFSGSGGWMGLNRSFPLPYAASAQKVLDAAPDWVLAEHGGPFEFSAEDFRRRVQWGQASAKSADVLCPSGNHLVDWNPHRIHFEPLVQKAKPGAKLKGTLVVSNPLAKAAKVLVRLEGRAFLADQNWDADAAAGATVRHEVNFQLKNDVPAGRQIFPLRVMREGALDPVDAFLAVDVEAP